MKLLYVARPDPFSVAVPSVAVPSIATRVLESDSVPLFWNGAPGKRDSEMAFVVHPITDGFSSSSSLPSISRSQRMRKLFSRKCQGTVEMSRCWQSRNVPTSVLPAAEVVMKTMKHHDVRGPEETVHQLPQTHSPSLSLRLWVARWGLVKLRSGSTRFGPVNFSLTSFRATRGQPVFSTRSSFRTLRDSHCVGCTILD